MLIITGDHDDRVVPLHSYKYMASLQQIAGRVKGQRPLLIKVEKDAGHGGSTNMKEAIAGEAEIFAFFAKVTGTPYKQSNNWEIKIQVK